MSPIGPLITVMLFFFLPMSLQLHLLQCFEHVSTTVLAMWKTLPVTPLQCAESVLCAEICQRFELYVTVCSLVEMPRFSKDETIQFPKDVSLSHLLSKV